MISTQQVRRPLIGIALSIAAGIGLQRWISGDPLLCLSSLAFLLAWVCWIGFKSATPLMYIACGLLAAAHGAIQEMPSTSSAALPVAEVSLYEQELAGTVEDEPIGSGADATVSFLFRAVAVRVDQAWIQSDAVLQVYLKNSVEPIHLGEPWRLRGRYTGYDKPRGRMNGFLSATGAHAFNIKAGKSSLASRCGEVRRRAAAWLRLGVEPLSEQTGLLEAMLLGYRQAIAPALNQAFIRTGTLHIFAISGQHIVILGAIFIAGLKLVGLSRPYWGLLLLPALFLYIFTTGLQSSALRALAMASVFFVAPLARRRPDAPSSIALATILLLAFEPANIVEPGFLLSFVVVCGLIMVNGWGLRQISGLRLTAWEVPLKQLSGSHPAAALLRHTGLLMLTSLAAWLFSAPITAWFFNTLSPIALISNLAVIPLTFMIMLAGCLALVSGALFFPSAVSLFNQANVLFINVLIWMVQRLAEWPGACRAVRAPCALVMGLWYAGFVLFFTGPARWRKGALLLVLLSVLLWGSAQRSVIGGITVLRAGDSAVALRLPKKNQWVVITDGSPFSATRVIRLLQKEGVNQLHTLVVSDEQADAETIQRLQTLFHPEHVWSAAQGRDLYWAAEGGAVRVSLAR